MLTMKVKDALPYLVGIHNEIKSGLSDEIKNYLDECGYDIVGSIEKSKELIKDRFYMMDKDDEDYIRLNNMLEVLKNHYRIYTMLENKLIKGNTPIQINISNI
jgi:hypothetical protein